MPGNNTNIVHVEAVENLAISIQDHIDQIEPKTAKEHEVKWDAQEFMNMYQITQIKALREAYASGV